MASELTIFLDYGGVMNDNAVRAVQYRRLVGEFFAPRLGGDQESWARANWAIIGDEPWLTVLRRFEEQPQLGFQKFHEDYLCDWLRSMCDRVGVVFPDRAEAVSMATVATAYITRRVHSAFPGAVEAIRELHSSGHALHTASGSHSADLGGYMEAMGLTGMFGRLYGPNLVDMPKMGVAYYERIFADAGVEPNRALVVDDSVRSVAWARETSAQVVLVSKDAPPHGEDHGIVGSLAELPAYVDRFLSM